MSGKIRFAPSPTGYLHEGHLLSALYVWAAAAKWDLKIHLRIEDHDRSRAREEYITGIKEDLDWFGFRYDSESIQRDHEEAYQAALQKLEAAHLVYPCYCSRKQLEAENPKSETGEIIYQGKCRGQFTIQNSQFKIGAAGCSQFTIQNSQFKIGTAGNNIPDITAPHNLRFKVTDKVIHWDDLRLGAFDENPKLQCGDFPIRDRDGQWTYQFAVCVDDINEGITHIVRGEDIRNSTARQIMLMQALGREIPPLYLHHPLISDSSGKKLSKRELAHSLRQDRAAGATPEELLGRVCYKAGFASDASPLPLKQALSLIQKKL